MQFPKKEVDVKTQTLDEQMLPYAQKLYKASMYRPAKINAFLTGCRVTKHVADKNIAELKAINDLIVDENKKLQQKIDEMGASIAKFIGETDDVISFLTSMGLEYNSKK